MIILRKYKFKFAVLSLLSLFFLGLSVRYASLKEITENSHLIVHGKVDSYYSVWEENNIYTYIKINIYESLKGSDKNKQIMIKQLGGTVGDISQEISGTPKLWQDSEVFLFLVNWKGAYWIHSVILGYYEVVEVNGTKYAVNNFNNVELIDAKTGKPIEDKRHIKTNYELSSFKSEINSIVRGGQK
jgi:hypothetical protein